MSARTINVIDKEGVLSSLTNGEPVTMKDAILRPVSSQKRSKLLADMAHLEAQLGRLAKVARDMRAEVLSLTVEN